MPKIKQRICVQCGNDYLGQGIKYCSPTCSYEARKGVSINIGSTPWNKGIKWPELSEARKGSGNPAWRGGVMQRQGYRFILMPEHPNANKRGYVAEHRMVMEKKIQRPLLSSEQVHHIDHDKTNNSPDNLVILTRSEHLKLHRNSEK